MSHMSAASRWLIASLVIVPGAPALAGTQTFTVYLDTDANTATGCTATTSKGPFAGAELALVTTVTTSTSGAQVTGVQLAVCGGASFGALQTIDPGGWPVGIGNGDGGAAVIETYLPISFLGGASAVRAGIASLSQVGGTDALLAGVNQGPILIQLPAPVAEIPTLSAAMLALMALLLGVAGWRLLVRRRRAQALFVALLLGGATMALAVVLDGQIGDWAGIPVLAAQPFGDGTPVDARLVSFYAQVADQKLYLRIDANVQRDQVTTGGPPTLDPVRDQSIPSNKTLSLRLVGHNGNGFGLLTYSLVTGPQGATVSPEGVFAFTPSASQLGGHGVGVQVLQNDGLTAQTSFTVTVVDHDHAPVLGPLGDDTTSIGASYTKVLTATDPDPGDTLTFTLLSGPAGMTLSGATLSWTPTAGQLGSWPVEVKVTDRAGLSDSGLFHVSLPFFNATDDSYSVRLGQTVTVAAPGVLGNDVDPLGEPLSAAKLSDPDKGMLTAFNADGSFTYQAPPVLPGPVFAPVVKYHIDESWFYSYSPLVLDLDGDGKPEIVTNSLNAAGSGLKAYHGTDGSVLWDVPGFPAPYDDCTTFGVGGNVFRFAAGDIDDSGAPSIVAAVACRRDDPVAAVPARYIALNGKDGTVKWLSPTLGAARENGFPDRLAEGTVPTIARLRPGETPSIVIGRDLSGDFAGQPKCAQLVPGWPAGTSCRGVIVLDGRDGTVRQSMAAPSTGGDNTTYGNGTQAPVVADLAGDGNVEIVFGGAVFNNDGSVRWNDSARLTYWNGLGNFDDTPDIEVARLDSGVGGGVSRLAVFKSDGSLLWSVPLLQTAPSGVYLSVPVVADVDGSGRPAVVLSVNSNVCAVDYQGNYKWCHDAGSTNGTPNIPFGVRLQVYDLQGDGVPEVIIPLENEKLLFLDGATGDVKATLDMAAANGPPLVQRIGDYLGDPVIADLDGSGHAAIVSLWNEDARLDVVTSQNNDWRPARKVFNQKSYQFGNIDDDGTIPPVFVNNFATPATNVFGNQGQVLPPVDPKKKSETSFTYAASDGTLTSSPGTVTIDILPLNRPPVFVTTPPTRYVPGPFTYAAHAVDPDAGDTVTYSLTLAQGNGGGAGCSIDAASGLLSCSYLFFGDQSFVLAATDSQGAAGYQVINLQQSAGSATVPDVVGQTQALAGATLTGAGFSAGKVTQIDDAAPAGQVIQQSPAAGTSALLGSSVDLVVSKGPPPPPLPPGPPPQLGNIARIVVDPATALRIVGDTVPYKATAIYTDHTGADITPFAAWSSTAPGVATVDAAGNARALGAGTTLLTATAGGLSGQAALTVAARVPGDQTPPTAAITAPADGGMVTGLTQILGTAADENFLRYELALAASGDTTFTLIGGGTTAVMNGVLGTFDPTLLLNQIYTLRLTAFDANGNSSTAQVAIQVDGGQKVGAFTITYTDLTVLLSGLPIQVLRTYDSRDKRKGDFGVGWNLGVNALRVSSSCVLGAGWQTIEESQNFGLVPGNDHFVSVTLPTGKVEAFDLLLSPSTSFLVPITTLQASFAARPGTLGTLQSLDNVNLLITDPQPGPITLLDDSTLNTFNPDRFLYTGKDGTQWVVTRTHGIESVKDTNGNQITFGPAGITHSLGTSIAFSRDSSGRITGITDPLGKTLTYGYSPAGDLAAATDRAANTTSYFYNATHGLVRIQDPLGRPVSRADYDDQGRLISLTDATGHTTTYKHDLPGRQELATDALGRVTVSNYDARGNVTAVTDPLGNTTTSTYDNQDNLLTRTDPLGATTTWTYNAQDDVLSVTDSLNRQTVYTRDAAGRPLTVTDARGNTVMLRYDANGNLLGTTDALGVTTSSTYDAAGNPTTYTDPAGAIASNQYDASGRRTQTVDPLGNVTSLQYDASGNILSQRTSGAAWALTYDPNGRITATNVGTLTRGVARDATGSISSVTTASGQSIAVATDPAGRATGLIDPSGTALRQQSYDEVGNVQSVTDALGNRTTYTYDSANRLITTTYPDGSTIQNAYDAAGHNTQTTDQRGQVTSYQYDLAGQLTMQTDPLGGQTRYGYDAVGNVASITDPAGRTTTYTHDAGNRLIRTTNPDGTSTSSVFDAAGRTLSSTDEAGHTIAWTYDFLGRLTSATDPLGDKTTYSYQGAGPRTGVVDANGRSTVFAYDDHERLTATVHPLGDTETATYDPAGHVLSKTNGAGETVQYQYDPQGRLASVQKAGAVATYTYTADGLLGSVRNAQGLTSFTYDPVTRRIARVTEPDGTYVRYRHDAIGNRTLVAHGGLAAELVTTYSYDALNRMIQVSDPDGGVTTQTWNAAGNLAVLTRPNGLATTTTYDSRNRPLTITSRDAGGTVLQQQTYTLDALGNRTRVAEADGSHADYQYDAVGRVTSERHYDGGGTLQLDLTYEYDPAGNLVSAGPTAAPLTFVFNADDELVSGGGVTYTNDLAGRRIQESFMQGASMVSRSYAWDPEDRLLSFQDTAGATTTYTYDDLGVRQAKGGAVGAVTFLTDRSSPTGFSQLLRETSLTGVNTFVWGTRLLETNEADIPRFHLFDALGSTRLLADATGAVSDTFTYEAYGQLLQHVGASGARHRFAGEETDLESGLSFLRARYYDPRTRVFLTRDPGVGNDFAPLTHHPYLYASGNPVNLVDPSGRDTLLEQLQVLQTNSIVEKGVEIQNLRKGVQQTEDVVADVMRGAGAVLAVEALVEAFQSSSKSRVLHWFGGALALGAPVGAVLGKLDLGGAGSFFDLVAGSAADAVGLGAEVALGKAAFDMFNRTDVNLDLQAGYLGNWSAAAAGHSSATTGHRSCSTDPTWHAVATREQSFTGPVTWSLGLCRPFFSDPPFPRSLLQPSMAGVMVHEFMHIASNRLIRDEAYNCSLVGFDPSKQGVLALKTAIPGPALFNADSYRCWVEDSAIGGGNAKIEARLPAP